MFFSWIEQCNKPNLMKFISQRNHKKWKPKKTQSTMKPFPKTKRNDLDVKWKEIWFRLWNSNNDKLSTACTVQTQKKNRPIELNGEPEFSWNAIGFHIMFRLSFGWCNSITIVFYHKMPFDMSIYMNNNEVAVKATLIISSK